MQILEMGQEGWWYGRLWNETCPLCDACKGTQLDMPGTCIKQIFALVTGVDVNVFYSYFILALFKKTNY